jgi:glycerol-3-phosphate O-acyltransferase 3/4
VCLPQLKLMTSWAVVCNVYFLEPQQIRKGETAQEFASRVQHLIARKASLKVAPWDGYLKYYSYGVKHPELIEKKRAVIAQSLREHL